MLPESVRVSELEQLVDTTDLWLPVDRIRMRWATLAPFGWSGPQGELRAHPRVRSVRLGQELASIVSSHTDDDVWKWRRRQRVSASSTPAVGASFVDVVPYQS